jgi:hypothetical protein
MQATSALASKTNSYCNTLSIPDSCIYLGW